MNIKKIIKLVVFFTGLFYFTLSHAAFVHTDGYTTYSNGVFTYTHGYTLDMDSGLEWGDMSFTDGLSYDEAVTKMQSGNLVGWRFATSAEFDGLMFNANGGSYAEGRSNSTFTAMENLISLFGSTYAENSFAYAVGFVDSAGQNIAHARQFGYLASGDPSLSRGFIRPDLDTSWDKSFDESSASVGSFVVRETSAAPIPSAIWLFSSGLLGLIGVARRR